MKKYISVFLLIFITTLTAQETKHLTLEDAVLGRSKGLYPKNKSIQWVSNSDLFAYAEKNALFTEPAFHNTKEKIAPILQLQELQKEVKGLKRFPRFSSITSEEDFLHSLMGALTPDSDYLALKQHFPKPEEKWIDAKHDSLGQLEAYSYLAPVAEKIFLQLGGSGAHAVKALLAGSEVALLLTPMIEEARVAMRLAEKFGVADKLGCIIAVGEELPFAEESIDLVYSGGCFHHMRLDHASKELHRVLKKGGKFSGVDPWKTLLHTIGTNVIGKREKSVFCKPITPERLAPMQAQFSDITVNHHGPLLRYVFLALEKAKLNFPITTMFKVSKIDDSLGKAVGISKHGGSIMIAGTK